MARFAWLIAALILLQPAFATEVNEPDAAFLKEEPYRKQKQKIDLSSIKTEHDMQIVTQAVNPVMRFVVGLVFAEVPPAVDRELLTEHGRSVLRRPPLRNKFNRYSSHRISDWRVCGDNTLSVNVVFTDLFQKKFWSEDFLFINDGNGWRFEDHKKVECSKLSPMKNSKDPGEIMAEVDYEFVGKFIYGAHRHGGDQTDITNWMADELGVARPHVGDDPAAFALYAAYCSRYNHDGQLEEGLARFIETLKNRPH